MKKIPVTILLVLAVSLCVTENNPDTTTEVTQELPTADTANPLASTPFGVYTTPRLYQYLPQLGGSWTFIGVLWGDIEPEQDVWDFEKADRILQEAQENRINLVVKIRTGTCWATKEKEKSGEKQPSSPPENLDDYTEFVYTLVTRYKDAVTYWAVENEVNTPRFWKGTLEEYNLILETAYTTIKKADPSAHVLDSGMASMTYGICIAREMYEKGEPQEAITFFNQYYRKRGLSVSTEEELNQALYSEETERTYTIMMDHFNSQYYDVYQLHYYEDYSLLDEVIHFIESHLKEEKPIFAVEMGYAYRDDGTYNEKDHAEDTVKLMVSLLKEGIPVQIYLPLIDLNADIEGHEEWRGLVSPEGERRPALYGYRLTAELLKDKKFTREGDLDVCWYEFEDVTVVWSEEPATISVDRRAVILDIYGERTHVTDSLSLPVGSSPLFIVELEYESKYEIGENIEIVEFPSYDGVTVEGFLRKPEGTGVFPAVVLVHGGISSREAAAQMAANIGEQFVNNRYVVLAVHYRGGPLGLEDVEDTLSAIHYLKQLDFVNPERIGVYGGSHGGYVALMCAWRSDVKCVVEAAGFCDLADMVTRLESRGRLMDEMIQFYGGYPHEVPDAYLEYSPCGHIPEFTAAVFIIHGKQDSSVPVEHAYLLSELLEEYKKPYEMYISETGEHGFYHTNSEEAQIVWELIFQFFEKYLKL